MINMTTLCYIEQDNCYLMMHRIKKSNDVNKDKWVGIGGHFEKDETPEECLLREVNEETGLTLKDYHLRGIITFISDLYETEYMFLYTATLFEHISEGDLPDCNEGMLKWVKKDDIPKLPIWEGDKLFFELLDTTKDFFTLKLRYEGDKLVEASKNGVSLYSTQ